MSCNCESNTPACCQDPCKISNSNTAACESLPSALDNFIREFFGEVEKTETNGKVTWTLPCDLSEGLPTNPRLKGEGLACFFLRLFDEGLEGLTGPQGDQGEAGTNGNNAYTVTLAGFSQPAAGGAISLKILANPVVKPGLYIFIEGSGWFRVDAAGADSIYALTIKQPLSSVTVGSTVNAGKLVVATGPEGPQGPIGDKGDQGDQGAQGTPGTSFVSQNAYVRCGGSNYATQVTFNPVVFAGEEPEITLPAAGKYLIMVTVGVYLDNSAAAIPGEQIFVKLHNTVTGTDVFDSDRMSQCFGPGERGQINITVKMSVSGSGQTLRLYAKATQADKAYVLPVETTLFYMRLS